MPATATLHPCMAFWRGARLSPGRGMPTCVCANPERVWPPLGLRSRGVAGEQKGRALGAAGIAAGAAVGIRRRAGGFLKLDKRLARRALCNVRD